MDGECTMYCFISHFRHSLSLSFSLFLCHIVKPTSINITSKPKHFASEIEYSINCEVDGSIPETEIRWTQNNRPFKRGKVSKMWWEQTHAYQFHDPHMKPHCNVMLYYIIIYVVCLYIYLYGMYSIAYMMFAKL